MSVYTSAFANQRNLMRDNPARFYREISATNFAIYRYGIGAEVENRARFRHDTIALSAARDVQEREADPAIVHDRCASCQTRLPIGLLQYPANPINGAAGKRAFCMLCVIASHEANAPIARNCVLCSRSFEARGMTQFIRRAESRNPWHQAHEKVLTCAPCAISLLNVTHADADDRRLNFANYAIVRTREAREAYYATNEADAEREAHRVYIATYEAERALTEAFCTNRYAERAARDRDVFLCDDCGTIAERPYMRNGAAEFTYTDANGDEWDGAIVCQDCADRYRTCEHCGDTWQEGTDEYEDAIALPSHGEYVCRSCYDDNYFTCEHCDNVYSSDDSRETPRGATWCDSCWDDRYTYCGRCDDAVSQSATYSTDAWGTVCESCYEDSDEYRDREDEDALDCYSTDVRAVTGIYAEDGALCFGAELEYEVTDGYSVRDVRDEVLGRIGKYSVCKSDSSLDRGLEVVTAPLELDKAREVMQKLLSAGISGARAADTCGLHVHISKSALTPSQVARIILFMGTEANMQFLSAIARRNLDGHGYAKLHDRSWRAIVSQYERREWDEAREEYVHVMRWNIGADEDRYQALNVTSKGTLEFRLFASTTKAHQAIAALEFCGALAAFAKAHIPIALARSPRAFVSFVLAHAKEYPALADRFGKQKFAPWRDEVADAERAA